MTFTVFVDLHQPVPQSAVAGLIENLVNTGNQLLQIEVAPARRHARGRTTDEEAHARTGDPETSHEAAESVANIRESQEAILSLFEPGVQMIDEVLVGTYTILASQGLLPMQSTSGIRTRRAELVDRGELEDSGERTVTSKGRRAIKWQRR